MAEMKAFLIILDGCSVEELKKAKTPFIDEISKAGQSTDRCRAVFPTATYTGHSSIITGNYPEKHGMVGNRFWDRYNQCIRDFDYFDPNKNIQSPTIFELLSERITSCAICEPVTKGASLIREKKIFDQIPLESQNKVIFEHLKEVSSQKIDFCIVNFQGVDGFGERDGPEGLSYLKCLEEVDGYLSSLVNELQGRFLFIITADHGMTRVNQNIDLGRELTDAGFRVKALASHRTVHLYSEARIRDLEQHLETLPYLHKVLKLEDIERVHLSHKRTGDLVVSAKEGTEFGDKILKGSHGGATLKELIVPLIFYDSKEKIWNNVNLDDASLLDICPTILPLFRSHSQITFHGKNLLRDS